MAVKFSINEVQFLTNLMFEIIHDRVELSKLPTEYDYSNLNYKSIADNLVDKLMEFEKELEAQVTSTYVSKVVFAEWSDVEALKPFNVIQSVDYGNSEITSDVVSNLITDLEEDEENFDFTKEELIEELNNSLGSDVANALIKGTIDYVQVVE